MVTPPYLHGSKTIQELIEPIVRSESYGILRSHLIKSIGKQIEAGNIPYFYITLYEHSLYTLDHKEVVNNWICFDKGGFSVIIKRLDNLTKKRIQEQLCIIDEAVNFFLDVRNEKTKMERIRPTRNGLLNRKELLLAVNRIDSEIRKRMIEVENEIGFVCRTRNSYDGKFQVCLMNDSLYDGLLGVCLFYRSLYNYSLNQKHKTIADRIFKQLCDRRHKAYKDIEKVKVPISPLSGITGILYLMERYPEYYDEGIYVSIVEEIKHLLQITTQYDYMSGLTGLIFLIIQCKFIDEKDRLDILRNAGERLAKLANSTVDGMIYWTYVDGNRFIGENDMVLGGFAHGSSSIAIALYELFKYLKEQRYYDMFKQALSHDRSFYSDEIKGWLDGRDLKSKQDSGSWCHGAAGIALSRLILKSEGFTDVVMRKEFDVSFNQIERRIGYNLCVCHGTMGNLEVLNALPVNGQDNSCCINWLNSVVNEINMGKDIICGDNNRNSQVGLFMGFAGIGYQLLRFYDWERLPSILCLEISPMIDSLHENKRKPKSI